MGDNPSPSSSALADLPDDELAAYGQALGLDALPQTPRGELIRLVRERLEVLLELDHDAMLDIAAWARLPVRRTDGKETLARQIAGITKYRFAGLSDRGLRTLARLRGLELRPEEPRPHLERRLRRRGGLLATLRRKRRSVVGSIFASLVDNASDQQEYRFLPDQVSPASLKERIEEVGVVGGIAQKLRGAADHYVQQKLDEIEQRIDRKLDEIDRRLCAWRDQEVTNRLRIIKLTLVGAIIVAVVSLGYDYVKSRTVGPSPAVHALGARGE